MVRRFFLAILCLILASVVWGRAKNIRLDFFSSPSPVTAGEEVTVPILMYHKVNPDSSTGGLGLRVPPDKFSEQMEYLDKNGYHPVSLADFVAYVKEGRPLPPRPVVITFDDGYLDNYTYAFPVLKKYGFPATIFVVANCVGKTNEFDTKAGLQPENRLAGWDELQEMAEYGITIGSHTLDHPRLTKLSAAEAYRQIKESREVIARNLNRPVLFFSYPYGSCNPELARMVAESGYLAAVTTEQGLATRDSDLFLLKRVRVLGTYSLKKFIAELNRDKGKKNYE